MFDISVELSTKTIKWLIFKKLTIFFWILKIILIFIGFFIKYSKIIDKIDLTKKSQYRESNYLDEIIFIIILGVIQTTIHL